MPGRWAPVRIGLLTSAWIAVGCAPATPEEAGRGPADAGPENQDVSLPELPEPAPWNPSPGEVLLEAKHSAARVIAQLTTYPYDSTPEAVVEGLEHAEDVRLAASELVRPDAASAGRVVYPQLVGARDEAAAVTVLVEQTLRVEGLDDIVQARVVDVRLARVDGRWEVTSIPSGGGVPVAVPPDLPAAAASVLAHPAIHVPHTGRWDIYRGEIAPELLDLLLLIAERHEIHLLSLSGGRPSFVFGTDRTSHHARGRAVDIHMVDGIPVIEQRSEETPAHRLVTWLFELGLPELGSPWALDDFGGRSFTDLVHQDHIHIAVGP